MRKILAGLMGIFGLSGLVEVRPSPGQPIPEPMVNESPRENEPGQKVYVSMKGTGLRYHSRLSCIALRKVKDEDIAEMGRELADDHFISCRICNKAKLS